MRFIILSVVVLSLVLCAGCAKQESAPADQPAPAVEAPAADADPIAAEDFESGEAEGMETAQEAAEEEGGDTKETP